MKNIDVVVFAPKKDKAADWEFHPNAKVRKEYPEVEREYEGMDAQPGEFLSLKVLTRSMLKTTQVIEITEGRVELKKFNSDWEELGSPPPDADEAICWDIERIISSWTSDD